MSQKLALQLSSRTRFAAWLRHYPSAAFWQPWHMGVLHHGGVIASQPPVSVMTPLYHPASGPRSPASELLLRFEQRTVLGFLPNVIRFPVTVPRTLLSACAAFPPSGLNAFWGNLQTHVARHLSPQDQPSFDAAAQAVRAELRLRRIDPDGVPGFFPSAVTDADSYAALARALLYLATLPHSPLQLRLYCPQNAAFSPPSALSINIDVPLGFLSAHGQLATRELVLGLTLASSEVIHVPGGSVTVPVLSAEINFATLFVAGAGLASQIRRAGYASTLFLQ